MVDFGYKYNFTTVDWKNIGPFGSLTVYISPLTVSRLYSLSQCPAWPIFPSLYIKTGEFSGKSYTISVLGLLHIFRVSTIWRSVYSFWISTMAFLIIFTCCVTDGDSISDLTIRGYILNTNSIGTNPLGLVVSLMALNAIYNVISLLILRISTVIIWYTHYSGLWYHFIILMELWALTGTPFILIPIVFIYCLNSLLIKFLPVSCITKSGSPRYMLI